MQAFMGPLFRGVKAVDWYGCGFVYRVEVSEGGVDVIISIQLGVPGRAGRNRRCFSVVVRSVQ